MDKIVIIVADLGRFKAYRVTRDSLKISPRVTMIDSYDSIEGHGKLGDKLSDAAGRFSRGGGKDEVAQGSGERHNIGLETEKKIIKMIAKDIGAVVDSEKCEKWYLAAGEKINSQIVANLKPEVKAKLDKNIIANLSKINQFEILSHFIEK
jgi:hypothetical protein